MAQPEAEAYMLPRDASESQRLDSQHLWMKAIAHDRLLHPSIPIRPVRAVADVATGTGVWIRDAASSWLSLGGSESEQVDFVGFDISSSQFSKSDIPNVRFCVHDATQSFPTEYREMFDIVNVRLVSYAIKADDLAKTVQNIADILRPGGYLNWQECDIIDAWDVPESDKSRNLVASVVAEKKARGLCPAIVSPLLKVIETSTVSVPSGSVNSMTWTKQLLRTVQLQTISTKDHPELLVREQTEPIILKTLTSMLQTGIERRKALAADRGAPWPESQEDRFIIDFVAETAGKGAMANSVRDDSTTTGSSWNCEMSWIVARKAIIKGQNEAWMSARYEIY